MPRRTFESRNSWPGHSRCVGLWLVVLLSMLTFISCTNGAVASDSVVAHEQKAFFEAWLRRDLRGDELRMVTDEFVAFYAKTGKNTAGIHEATRLFLDYARTLREQDGTPKALTLRHLLLEASYFDRSMHNTTELRLLAEPDPVRVVDRKTKRLMTERDLVALVNVNTFAKSQGEPRHEDVSRQEIDRMAIALNRTFGKQFPAEWMPRFFTEMAAFWRGVRQEWPRLNNEEKRQVRAYSMKGYEALFNDYRMYGRLLGLDNSAAMERRSKDITDISYHVLLKTWESRDLIDTLTRIPNQTPHTP